MSLDANIEAAKMEVTKSAATRSEATIGIDIGSSSVKGVLLGVASNDVEGLAIEPVAARIPDAPAGYYEEDPYAFLDATYKVLTSLALFAKEKHLHITDIAFTGQMHGGLIIDDENGPLTNFITWQDKRGDEPFDGKPLVEHLRELLPEEIWRETGSNVFTGFLGVTIHSLLRKGGLPPKSYKIVGIYDWIALSLTGAEAFTDATSAAARGLYSIKHKTWSSQIADALGINQDLLPPICDTGEIIGNVSEEKSAWLGFPEGIRVRSGLGDTQASFIGSGCKPNELLLNFGTGSQAMWQIDNFELHPNTDTRYLPGNKYLITVPTLAGWKAYTDLAKFFQDVLQSFGHKVREETIYARMNHLAEHIPYAHGVTATPLFNGSRFLGEDVRASISGLDGDNFSMQNLTRAMLEGMVREIGAPYLNIYNTVQHKGLVGSGNGVRRNTALQKICEEYFHLPMRLSAYAEEAALGAALVATGNFSSGRVYTSNDNS